MLNQNIVIQNKSGLHARPAAQLVELCSRYDSDITILLPEMEIDAKSIIDVLSGGMNPGTSITLQVDGPDEAQAFSAVTDFLHHLPD